MARLLCVALLVLLGITGCSGEPEPLNLIVVLVDTLRADHMSVYGYERPTTPFLDRLAGEGVLFERARAQSACTFPSVNSILTSRYPFDFYRQATGSMGIPEQYPTLAEILRARGYRTHAVSASPVVRKTPTSHNPVGGFGRGFDTFDEHCLWQPAACVNRRALTAVESTRQPFFLYLHYMDPHGPYQPPAGHERLFAGPYDGPAFITEGDTRPIIKSLDGTGSSLEISERDIGHLRDLYDEEVSYLDGQLRLLVDRLRELQLLERSLLVLLADHGEAFLEHGDIGHCRGVWDNQTRTPLLLRWPGGPQGVRLASAVQNLDLVPTVLGILGIDRSGLQLEGTSLLPLLDGQAGGERLAFADYGSYRSVDDGSVKLVLDGTAASLELYDLRKDPNECTNLYSPDHPDAKRLGPELTRWLRESGQLEHFAEALEDARESEEQLRALGYLW